MNDDKLNNTIKELIDDNTDTENVKVEDPIDYDNPLIEWRDTNLNTISKSFCAAKWYNASLHLGSGFTNSCHLPLPHPIDIEAIKKNPAALHNTEIKKQARKMMLESVRPAECSYCWKIEDIGRNNVSDRIFKSNIYSKEDIQKIPKMKWNDDVLLKTVEISFDRTCNFACSYCNAGYSTTWGKDIKKNGPYQIFKTSSAGAYQSDGSWSDKYTKGDTENPFVEAFIEWYPELIKELQELRITGGEPIMSHNFWKFLDVVKQHPSDKLRIAINSNMGDTKRLQKLIEMTHELPINEFDLYTSNESFGSHAEYIRDGLIYSEWRDNLVNFIENAKFRALTVMMTINSLSLFSITEFMDDMLVLKTKYAHHRPNLDLNILRWPAFMSPLALPTDIKIKLHTKLKIWYDTNKSNKLLGENELTQIQRLLDYIEVVDKGHVTTEDEQEKHFHDFKSFYEQYDVRRGKSFRKTFPELTEWYDSIEIDNSIPKVGMKDGTINNYEVGEYTSNS
jgi:organic radical activating enzyme